MLTMGRDRIEQRTLELFSTDGVTDPSPTQATDVTATRVPPRLVLPNDLPKAIKYLDDRELDRLLAVAIEEARQRGRQPPSLEASAAKPVASSAGAIPKQLLPTGRVSRQRQVGIATASLTRGQVNAVRAAFKAGVTLSRIARQFGLTQSDVRKALASDETKR